MKGTATFQAGVQHSQQACRTSSKLWHVLSSAQHCDGAPGGRIRRGDRGTANVDGMRDSAACGRGEDELASSQLCDILQHTPSGSTPYKQAPNV